MCLTKNHYMDFPKNNEAKKILNFLAKKAGESYVIVERHYPDTLRSDSIMTLRISHKYNYVFWLNDNMQMCPIFIPAKASECEYDSCIWEMFLKLCLELCKKHDLLFMDGKSCYKIFMNYGTTLESIMIDMDLAVEK